MKRKPDQSQIRTPASELIVNVGCGNMCGRSAEVIMKDDRLLCEECAQKEENSKPA